MVNNDVMRLHVKNIYCQQHFRSELISELELNHLRLFGLDFTVKCKVEVFDTRGPERLTVQHLEMEIFDLFRQRKTRHKRMPVLAVSFIAETNSGICKSVLEQCLGKNTNVIK